MLTADTTFDSLTEGIWSNATPLLCEHSQHPALHVPEECAKYIILSICPVCGRRVTYLLCHSGWLQAGAVGLHCNKDASKKFARDDAWTILEVL